MKPCAAIVMLIGIALGGCVTPVGTISAGHSLDASGESVVVGRVALTAEHETSGKTYTITCDARGFISDFYVAVPAGRYRISKAATAYLVSHFQAVFEVAPRDVVYVGTFQFTGGSGLLTWQNGVWEVVEEPDATLPAFPERFPQLNQTVTRSIAVRTPSR